jgi:hypothetical protein
LINPLNVTPDGRSKAKVALTAYETMQQAMLIYGHLPACDTDAGVLHFCRDAGVWNKVKIADKLAVRAINDAVPVLAGETPDSGEVVKAVIAIGQMRDALKEANSKMTVPQ